VEYINSLREQQHRVLEQASSWEQARQAQGYIQALNEMLKLENLRNG